MTYRISRGFYAMASILRSRQVTTPQSLFLRNSSPGQRLAGWVRSRRIDCLTEPGIVWSIVANHPKRRLLFKGRRLASTRPTKEFRGGASEPDPQAAARTLPSRAAHSPEPAGRRATTKPFSSSPRFPSLATLKKLPRIGRRPRRHRLRLLPPQLCQRLHHHRQIGRFVALELHAHGRDGRAVGLH